MVSKLDLSLKLLPTRNAPNGSISGEVVWMTKAQMALALDS
jgi:hypothetical protein